MLISCSPSSQFDSVIRNKQFTVDGYNQQPGEGKKRSHQIVGPRFVISHLDWLHFSQNRLIKTLCIFHSVQYANIVIRLA